MWLVTFPTCGNGVCKVINLIAVPLWKEACALSEVNVIHLNYQHCQRVRLWDLSRVHLICGKRSNSHASISKKLLDENEEELPVTFQKLLRCLSEDLPLGIQSINTKSFALFPQRPLRLFYIHQPFIVNFFGLPNG